jgi:hypothetical protein
MTYHLTIIAMAKVKEVEMGLPGFTAKATLTPRRRTYRARLSRKVALSGSVFPQQEFSNPSSAFPQISCLMREQFCRELGGYWVPCPRPPCFHCCAVP